MQSTEAAQAIIDGVERDYQDPGKMILFDDWRVPGDVELTVHYQRLLGTMSDRERFVLKFATVLERLGLLDKDKCGFFYASVLNGDGKGQQTIRPTYSDMDPELFEVYVKEYELEFAPWSVSKSFQMAYEKVSEAAARLPHTPYGQWCQAQLENRTPSASGATAGRRESKVFTQSRGAYDLPLGRLKADGPVTYYSGNRALVTIAPPDSGKSLAQAVPALLEFEGHVFVLDIKGQCFLKTWQERQKRPGGRIILFNPLDEATACYNPLQLVSDEADECWGEATTLAELMIPVQSKRDPSWELMGRRMMALFIAYVVLSNPVEDRHMNLVLDLVAGIGLDGALAAMVDSDTFPSAMRRAARSIQEIRDPKSHAQRAGILQAMEQNLSIWQDPRVERAIRKCDWSPRDFQSEKPITLYLTIPLESLSSYASLIRVIVAQHVFHLMRKLPEPDAKPIMFLLDEFPQLGQMDAVRKAIEAGRDYGIRTWMFAQFRRQFEDTYGDAGKGMVDICGVRMFMNPSFQDAEAISKEFGTRRDMLTEKREPNLPPDSIISPEHRDSVFVLSSNEEPLILSKNFV